MTMKKNRKKQNQSNPEQTELNQKSSDKDFLKEKHLQYMPR